MLLTPSTCPGILTEPYPAFQLRLHQPVHWFNLFAFCPCDLLGTPSQPPAIACFKEGRAAEQPFYAMHKACLNFLILPLLIACSKNQNLELSALGLTFELLTKSYQYREDNDVQTPKFFVDFLL